MTTPIINITVRWRAYGWVATAPGSAEESRHHSGPRLAADDLCHKIWGENPYVLKLKESLTAAATDTGIKLIRHYNRERHPMVASPGPDVP